jgi:hypothetical protein
MNGMRNRAVILVVAMAMLAGTLACGGSSLIGRQAEPSPTPTKTPKPTFTVTLTPTLTPIPTDTPTPTSTPLPTDTPLPPTPTFTPVPPTDTPLPPTDTPVPPTNTPQPTPRPTRRPTARPTPRPTTPPRPTNTPAPQYAWRGDVAGTFSNCALTQLMGLTLDRSGGVAGDIFVHYWTDGWNGAWAKSSWTVDQGYGGANTGDEKNWDGTIDSKPRPGTWYACVVPEEGSWTCVSEQMTVKTVHEPCSPDSGGIQVVRIVFQQN